MKQKREAVLKAEHRFVLQALEVANLAHSRLASVNEVIDALLPEQTELLQRTYAKSLTLSVSTILKNLLTRKYVFSPGLIGSKRYYGSVSVLNPSSAPLPNTQSYRSLALELVRDAVNKLGRAVRSRDILEYASKDSKFNSIEPVLIVRSVLSLAATGELITRAVRGDGGGINLYLPYGFDLKLFTQDCPLTWLEEIARYINEFWAERVAQANVEGAKPRPFSTGGFRGYIATKDFLFEPEPKGDPQNLVNALKSLSITRNPLLRRIKRPDEKACLWIPFGISEADVFLGNTYASDAERVDIAVQRATRRLGRPVKLQDVSEEIELDTSLQLTNSKALSRALPDISKEPIHTKSGVGRKRHLRVYRIGRIGNETYYDTSRKPESCNWLRFGQLKMRWEILNAEERLSNLSNGFIPSTIIGRALLVISDIEEIAQELNELLADGHLHEIIRDEVKILLKTISGTLKQAHNRLKANTSNTLNLPIEVNTEVVGWTAPELLEFMKLISPRAKKLTDHNYLISLMKSNIRRITNRNFVYRFSDDSQTNSDYLYDRTDAFIYAAKQWGGYECCTQAMIADTELERLRDLRFVLPALESPNFNIRFAGVACLAFLRAREGNHPLRNIAITDAEPGIRRSALWAYCFARGKNAQELLHDREVNDTNINVSQFAKKLMGVDVSNLWAL